MRRRVLIICAHLRRDRGKAADRDFLQPLAGVHIGSCIDHTKFDVNLYHEMWHGPFDTASIEPSSYELVFLTGLQQDFDRMRQLAFFFRRAGCRVVAGGNICTLFPEFATQFFDAVCVGGVEAVFAVVRDFEAGKLDRIYHGPRHGAGTFPVAYHLLAKAGIDLPIHLLEASRGCNFTCSFCVIPAEANGHLAYGLEALRRAIDISVADSPQWTLRRHFPMLWFMDNNFSDDRNYLKEMCAVIAEHGRVRAWGALITQNVLRDREMIALMARSKCRALFVGIESFDREFLQRTRKRQNLSKHQSVPDDVAFAERQGIAIVYSQLVDPRHADPAAVEADLLAIARDGRLPLPCFVSFISPLVGTEMFWECVARDELRPGLRMRELDGETIAFNNTRAPLPDLVEFGRRAFTQTWQLVPPFLVFANVVRRMVRARCFSPFRWLIALRCSWRMMKKASDYSRSSGRNYLAGVERLDMQYFEYPSDISPADRKLYFEPIVLIDKEGRLAEWLQPYQPAQIRATRTLVEQQSLQEIDGLPSVP